MEFNEGVCQNKGAFLLMSGGPPSDSYIKDALACGDLRFPYLV